MTVNEKTDELLTVFRRVSLLADRNGAKTLRLRHRTLGKDAVLHCLPAAAPVYETLCGIRQENLPAVYETYPLEDGFLVLEEYIDGLTVAEIAEAGRYRPRGAVRILRGVCRALTVLHGCGIVHRDIKPDNIMVDGSGRVVLIDFNAARHMSAGRRDTVVMGTVGYAPPEQLGLAQSDARTDIYACGVLLNVLLTGAHPSERIATGRCGRIVRRCTRVNAEERYRTAEKLEKALPYR